MLVPISQKSSVFPGRGSEQSEQRCFGWVGSGECTLARRGTDRAAGGRRARAVGKGVVDVSEGTGLAGHDKLTAQTG